MVPEVGFAAAAGAAPAVTVPAAADKGVTLTPDACSWAAACSRWVLAKEWLKLPGPKTSKSLAGSNCAAACVAASTVEASIKQAYRACLAPIVSDGSKGSSRL